MSIEDYAVMLQRVNSILDLSLNETVLPFEKMNEEAMNDSKRQITELSAPIVPSKERIVVFPFIGSIDEKRAAFIREKVVPQISNSRLFWDFIYR